MVRPHYDLVFFVGESNAVQYALSKYKQYRAQDKTVLLVVLRKSQYQFIQSLNLKAEVLYLHEAQSYAFRNPFKILYYKMYYLYFYYRYLRGIQGSDIYFTTIIYAWLVYGYLHRLYQHNTVIWLDYITYQRAMCQDISGLSFKHRLYQKINQWFAFSWCTSVIIRDLPTVLLDYQRYNIFKEKAEEDASIFSEFSISIGSLENKAILVLDSGHAQDRILQNYKQTMTMLVNTMTNENITVYIKEHPNVENQLNWVEGTYLKKLPYYIPAEFIDISGFSAVIGLYSTALANFSKRETIPVYSWMDLFEYKPKESDSSLGYDEWKQFILEESDHKIKFISSLDFIEM